MTKRQKQLCATPGCQNKAAVDFVLLGYDSKYFCIKDWVKYIGYDASRFMRSRYKELLIEGISLDNEIKEDYSIHDYGK